MTRNLFLRSIAASTLAATASAARKVPPINQDARGVAIRGYDPVAYFESQRPTPGKAEFTHTWMGAVWRFASASNRDRFATSPESYAPRFGGYCAWAVSNNYTAPIDPTAWTIEGGKLYLNYDSRIQDRWRKDLASRIAAGERNWPGLHD